MFEYVTLTVGWDHLQDVLNAWGQQGWRAVSISPYYGSNGVVLERRVMAVGP